MTETWVAALPAGSLVLAACSGGADSVYLVHHLYRVLPAAGHRLGVVHVNHRTRGADSDGDEKFVEELAGRLGVAFYCKRFGAEDAGANEGELREGRLTLLKGVARETGAAAIAFGHHRDDLAETFLLMALRGSGLAGLEGMRPVRRLMSGLLLLRPMLEMSRGEIEESLGERGETWRIDHTNQEMHQRRNFLRHRVVPLLLELDPAAVRKLAESARYCGEALAALEELQEPLRARVLIGRTRGALLFSTERLRRDVPQFMCVPLLRSLWGLLRDEEDRASPAGFGREDWEALARRAARTGDDAVFGNGPWAWVSNRFGVMSIHMRPEEACWELRVGLPFVFMEGGPVPVGTVAELGNTARQVRLGDDWLLRCSGEKIPADTDARWTAGFDLERVKGNVSIRSVSPEVEVSLPGGGHKAVGDCLREAGVPSFLRERIAGVADEGGVLWIPGVRQDAKCLVSQHSRGILHVAIAGVKKSGNPGPGEFV